MSLFDVIDALPDWLFWLIVIGVLTVISAMALSGSQTDGKDETKEGK